MSNILAINSAFGKTASARASEIEGKFKASAKAVIAENWMETNEDGLFRAAVGGVLLDIGSDSENVIRIIRTVETMRQFSQWIGAVQSGLQCELPEAPDENEVLPLMKWWKEVQDAKKELPTNPA